VAAQRIRSERVADRSSAEPARRGGRERGLHIRDVRRLDRSTHRRRHRTRRRGEPCVVRRRDHVDHRARSGGRNHLRRAVPHVLPLATLDYSSRGRGGWIPFRVTDPAVARVWGRPEISDSAALDREQRDSISVARDLWDSWEDDAVVRDYATGRFLDRDKLHYIDFEGDSFSVKGPAIVPRPPQGQLVIFGTEADRDQVDVVLVQNESTQNESTQRKTGLTFLELDVTLDVPGVSASERLELLNSYAQSAKSGRAEYVGDAAGLVTLLSETATRYDGVRLFPTVVDEDLRELARYVLPPLLKSGVAHRPVPGSSLRSNLGLTRPANRYERV
jgi:alkanesulfonate monooxygenase SsuD/methylene tetrahydromethanopterin reductase-like flavin-dependent oxidoreductase (luciferase family)